MNTILDICYVTIIVTMLAAIASSVIKPNEEQQLTQNISRESEELLSLEKKAAECADTLEERVTAAAKTHESLLKVQQRLQEAENQLAQVRDEQRALKAHLEKKRVGATSQTHR